MGPFKTSRLLAVALLVGLAGCATSVPLTTSQAVPAAQGMVKVAEGPNKNTRLTIEVKHLAPPSRVTPGATVYVAWARGVEPGGAAQNLGALVTDSDLNGRLETLTTLRVFDLLVTAEPSATSAAPTGAQVLTARISRR